MSKDLITLFNESELPDIFGDNDALEKLLREIAALVHVEERDRDVTTDAGRKRIASVAYSIARSKSFIDDRGKALAKHISERRKLASTALDSLKREFRRPLDEWERAEKERVSGLEKRLESLAALGEGIETAASAIIEHRITQLEDVEPETFQERQGDAEKEVQRLTGALRVALEHAHQREAEKAELEALRKEKAEREKERPVKTPEVDKVPAPDTGGESEPGPLERVPLAIAKHFEDAGCDAILAKELALDIAAGRVPHVSINYKQMHMHEPPLCTR